MRSESEPMNVSIIKLRPIVRKMPNGDLQATGGYLAYRAVGIPVLVRWSLVLFVCSFPFEATDLGFMTGSLSIPKLCGFLFFALYFMYYGPFSRIRRFPACSRPIRWFAVYLGVFVGSILFVPGSLFFQSVSRAFTLFQLLIFFWVASDLLRDLKTTRAILLGYAIACALLAIGNILGVPGFYQQVNPTRISGVGDNPNEVAAHMAIALIALLGLFLYRRDRSRIKVFSAALSLPIMTLMVRTGSRGGVLAFLVGCGVYLVPYWRSRRKFAAALLALTALSAVTYMVMATPQFSERWEEARQGYLSGRENIIPEAIGMIVEKPLLGWHPTVWFYELGDRLGIREGKDAHNLVLALLLEVGIAGTAPFLLALLFCARSAWRARIGRLGLLPTALFVGVLMTGMSGTTTAWKTQWLVLAFAMAAGTAVAIEEQSGRSSGPSVRPVAFTIRRSAKATRFSPQLHEPAGGSLHPRPTETLRNIK